MDGGAWWAAVHEVAKGQTQLSDFTFIFHFHALKKEMATHSNVLAWRIPGTGEPGGLPSMGSHRVGHNWSDLAAAAAAFQSCGVLNCFFSYEMWTQSLTPWSYTALFVVHRTWYGSLQHDSRTVLILFFRSSSFYLFFLFYCKGGKVQEILNRNNENMFLSSLGE